MPVFYVLSLIILIVAWRKRPAHYDGWRRHAGTIALVSATASLLLLPLIALLNHAIGPFRPSALSNWFGCGLILALFGLSGFSGRAGERFASVSALISSVMWLGVLLGTAAW